MATEYSSYFLEQQYESRDGGLTFFPTTPNVYRRSDVIKEENDEVCGYIPPIETIYRWIDEDIRYDWICDECGLQPCRIVDIDNPNFFQALIVSNNTTYIGTTGSDYPNDGGLYKLDNNGDVVKVNDIWVRSFGKNYDGTTYIGGSSYIYKITKDNKIINLHYPVNPRPFYIGLGGDNILYFLCPNDGIYKLDNSGNIVPTNITSGYWDYMGIGSNGVTYFCGNVGIYKLSEDGTIIPTNITSGYWEHMGIGSNGVTYFCGNANDGTINNGLLQLDENSGQIIAISQSIIGDFRFIGIGSDGKTYFCGNSDTYILSDDGTIKVFDDKPTKFMANANDGVIYFCGLPNSNLCKLDCNN